MRPVAGELTAFVLVALTVLFALVVVFALLVVFAFVVTAAAGRGFGVTGSGIVEMGLRTGAGAVAVAGTDGCVLGGALETARGGIGRGVVDAVTEGLTLGAADAGAAGIAAAGADTVGADALVAIAL